MCAGSLWPLPTPNWVKTRRLSRRCSKPSFSDRLEYLGSGWIPDSTRSEAIPGFGIWSGVLGFLEIKDRIRSICLGCANCLRPCNVLWFVERSDQAIGPGFILCLSGPIKNQIGAISEMFGGWVYVIVKLQAECVRLMTIGRLHGFISPDSWSNLGSEVCRRSCELHGVVALRPGCVA